MLRVLDGPIGTVSPDGPPGAQVAASSSTEPLYLSSRQVSIASMAADGCPLREIALELSLPLRTAQGHLDGVLRVLDLRHPGELTHELIAAHRAPSMQTVGPQSERMTALVRELAVVHVQLERQRLIEGQLKCALASRDTIGQAKGILMERYKISADAAFMALMKESGRSNRKLVEVAECLLYSGEAGIGRGRHR